jgi:hypothetical protein
MAGRAHRFNYLYGSIKKALPVWEKVEKEYNFTMIGKRLRKYFNRATFAMKFNHKKHYE